MGWNEDKLREHAHKLALEHDPHGSRISPKALWKQTEGHIEELRAFVSELHASRSSTNEQPAEEWLLDHSEFIEAEILGIRDEFAGTRIKPLPAVGKENARLRVSAICEAYLEQTDGLLDEDTLILYFNSYQEVSVLTIAEAWSVPLFLKMELIRRLAAIMEPVKERRSIGLQVNRLLAGIDASELTPERLRTALEEAHVEMPLSGALVVQLVRHLREHAEDSAHVGEWLVCKLENEPDSLDSILSYEYQLQAEYQVSTGNVINSLRKLSRFMWSEYFEKISMVENTLRTEQAGDYPRLDAGSRHTLRRRVEKLARRMRVPENLVASQAVGLANRHYAELGLPGGEVVSHPAGEAGAVQSQAQAVTAMAAGGDDLLPRKANAAYYLLEADGLRLLQAALKQCGKAGALPEAGIKKRAARLYFRLLALGSAAALALLALWIGRGASLSPWAWAAIAVLALLPATEFAVAALHGLIGKITEPTRLLRYDFSKGVPEDAATMVVIPVIWSRTEEVKSSFERLELHFLVNRDPNIHYAILSDFRDADTEHKPDDKAMLVLARAELERLNRTYPLSTFHLFHRRRMWNEREGVFMGWERKRGKLIEFVRLLRANGSTSFATVLGDTSVYPRIRYVITLDADTQLPLESGHRMIGAIHLPYNRPRLDKSGTRVAEGHGVLQPRIGMTFESARKTRLSSIWASEPGMDPYAFAVSDPYQDTVGEGIFTGKGIFDVLAFEAVLGSRFPENRILSHDLLEGGLLRAGYLSDIELIDDYPSTFLSHQKRLHRWTRGDWQLLPWLMHRTPDSRGERVPTGLSAVTRWQIIDNLRRSLLQPVLLIILLLAVPVLPGASWKWYVLALVTLLVPVVRQLFAFRMLVYRPRGLLNTSVQVLTTAMTLPFQSMMLLDAAVRTLYRLTVSKRKLLEWVNQSEVERQSGRDGAPILWGMAGGYLCTAALAAGSILWGTEAELALGVGVAVFWSLAPLAIHWLDQPLGEKAPSFSQEEKEELRQLARDIWAFYEEYVTGADHYLPPDNVQLEASRGIAHRTSPTNIGLYMACVLSARDFGFIDTPGMVERLEHTVETIEKLEKWQGHLYNWYDTSTLAPLLPVYVSTVDSGNLAACLMATREGMLEWLQKDTGLKQTHVPRAASSRWPRQEFDVAFADELSPERLRENGPADTEFAQDSAASKSAAALQARGSRLAARMEALVQDTNFRTLLDPKTNLFSLGFHVKQGVRDNVLYDLMASEARQASFVAIALGQVSVSHWNALGRTLTKVDNRPVLLSWSGTMFEYLMPWLFMKTYRNTLWDSTYKAAVRRQIDYARQRGVPFGISESGYYAFDYQMNYQYRAFGVPGLGFKRGLEQDLVLAPYATVMALPFAPREGLQALKQMRELGARGEHGFYEAIDFTRRRMPEGRKHMVIRSFMAHHQGMSMLTLSNMLLPQTMYDRFHRNKEVRAAELLLTERIPLRPRWIKHPEMYRSAAREDRGSSRLGEVREFKTAHTPTPEAALLSNGRFTTVISNSGGGFSSWDGLSLSRWREEPVRDHWGNCLYIWDVTTDRVWSPAFHPCGVEAEEERIRFEPDKASFLRRDGDVETRMEICVSPEADAEVRRITLANRGIVPKVLEVTTFMELALSSPIADDAHTAFSKLFIRTEYDEASGCLVADRRKRTLQDREMWAAHVLSAGAQALGPAEFETDRAAFIGRGYSLAEPQSIRTRLKGKTGSVADPVFVMRRRIQVDPGEEVQLYAVTAAAASREDAVRTAAMLAHAQAAERSFQLAWNRSRIELRNLGLELQEAASFQRLAGQVLYTPPMKAERALCIRANTKGQPGLWSFGVSGDRPVILAEADSRSQLPFMMKLLTGHEYLRRLGLRFDLVLLNKSSEGYQQDLQEALQRAVEHGIDRFGQQAAGIHVIPDNRLGEAERTLLLSVARVTLKAGGPSLLSQLRLPRRDGNLTADGQLKSGQEREPLPEAKKTAGSVPPFRGEITEAGLGSTLHLDPNTLRFYNGWGGFSQDGREYKLEIRDGKHLPAPWINVLANPEFGTIISELGTGYTFWRNSRECKLTPWSNDPILDPPGELGYLRDDASGAVWALTPASGSHPSAYLVTHGRGYTHFEHEREGIHHHMTVFVPAEDPVKLMRLRLRNHSGRARSLSVTYYAEWVLGVQRSANAPFIVTEWDGEAGILTAQNRYQEVFREATAFLGLFPQKVTTPESLSWTADQAEFIGRNGSPEQPAALGHSQLSGRTGVFSASCGAVQTKLELAPGEEAEVIMVLGCAASRELAAELARKYSHAAQCQKAMDQSAAFWDQTLNQTVVDTPSAEMNIILNGWLLYQSLCCRMWARTAFYQAGGAFGYRDQLQDSLALLHTAPHYTRRQILLHAAHQYEEGDVQHWWHEETERGIRTLFSDDLLWLPYTVSRYLEHTEDQSVLDETAPYLTSEPLREGEHERYEPTVLSSQSGTIYEHCIRAINKALSRTGEHNLPLIGVGDWNDGMNLVGDKGRGESVWLAWFLCDVLLRFQPVCASRGDEGHASLFRERREALIEAANAHAWDGQWYRRAFTDSGSWLGSIRNEECRIDSIAQSWSVISGGAPPERALQAMKSFDRELVDRELSVVKLLTPAFDKTDPSPGYIQGYPPGLRENGAQYTHGVIWSMAAWSRLGQGDKAFELFHMLNPITHTRTDQEVRQYVGEPYVMAADVYTSEPHRGHAGWTWYTGASSWMYQCGLEWILGIRRRGSRLLLDPCVPAGWPGFQVDYRVGSHTLYRLEFSRTAPTDSLQAGPEAWLELQDDGREHRISVALPS